MKRSNQLVLTAACTIALTLSSSAQAASPPTGPILFDPDGTGGANGASLVDAFDWSVSSFLAKDAIKQENGIPIPPAEGDTFQVYEQAYWVGMAKDGNGLPQPTGLFSNFEITLVTGMKVLVSQTIEMGDLRNLKTVEGANGENFFRMYYDSSPDVDVLNGEGYGNGHLILEGLIVKENSNNTADASFPLSDLDDFLGINPEWSGVNTVDAEGAQDATVLVTYRDEEFFPDLPVNSYLPYSTETVLAFSQTNPALNLTDISGNPVPSEVGAINGISGKDFLEQIDPSNSFSPIQPGLSCRVTGGGNDTSGIPADGSSGQDGTEASGVSYVTKKNGMMVVDNRYTFGGQAGANTALQPQPKGELSHTNHSGSAGQWTFHAGTASAPPGTEIADIVCSDDGYCRPARPAPSKQIDFDGIGSFRTINKIGSLDKHDCPAVPSDGTAPGNKTSPPKTYHWFEVHIEDLGEPGNEGNPHDPALNCPATGSGTDAFDNYFGPKIFSPADCGCSDFYRLRIYCGVVPDDIDGDGKADLDADGNVTNFAQIKNQKDNEPIYEVYGYINGGNWQIHPLTGFDLKGGQ